MNIIPILNFRKCKVQDWNWIFSSSIILEINALKKTDKMISVFANVEADIAEDLVCKFSKDFDFDAMLQKVCEDAGVVIVRVREMVEEECVLNKYRLKGLWLSMEMAYKQLVTVLAMYGSQRTVDIPLTDQVDLKDINSSEKENDIEQEQVDSDDLSLLPNICKTLDVKKESPQKTLCQCKIKCDELRNGEDNTSVSCVKKDIVCENEDMKFSQENIAPVLSLQKFSPELTVKSNEHFTHSRRGRPKKNDLLRSTLIKAKIISPCRKRESGRRKNVRTLINVEQVDLPGIEAFVGVGNTDKVLEESGYPCTECQYVAETKAKLQGHKLDRHFSYFVSCDLCSRTFPNKRCMMRHRSSHDEPRHCCDVCGKMYKVERAMIEHRKSHDSTPPEKPRFKCDMCSKHFCNRYILDGHIRDVHLGQKKSFLCSVCGKSFTTKHSLKEHSDAHIGIKPHICEVCGKSFSYESALRDHRFTHEESKHFWCKACNKGFSQRSGLKMHMRTHKQVKMFVCEECGRGFTQKQALQRHERVHKGEKPFICRLCGRFFTDASIIRRHMILVHKIQKGAKEWREDIICTVKSENEYNVQKIGEDQVSSTESVKLEEEISKIIRFQPSEPKGPSRAFARTYPRRVAILDDDGNILAPPEATPPKSKASKKLKLGNISGGNISVNKDVDEINPTNSFLLPSSNNTEKTSELDGWDAITSHLVAPSRTNATHIEHIILEESHSENQNDEIKYETLAGVTSLEPAVHGILSQPQPAQNPRTVIFAGQPSSSQMDSLTAQSQTPCSSSQVYEARPSCGSQWSSMLYYSQLANQFGMSITPDYTYVSSTNAVPVSQLASYISHGSSDLNSSAETFILQAPSHTLTAIQSQRSLDHTSGGMTYMRTSGADNTMIGSNIEMTEANQRTSECSLVSVETDATSRNYGHGGDMIHIQSDLQSPLKLDSSTLPPSSVLLPSDQLVKTSMNEMNVTEPETEGHMVSVDSTDRNVLVPATCLASTSSLEVKSSPSSLLLSTADLVKTEYNVSSQE